MLHLLINNTCLSWMTYFLSLVLDPVPIKSVKYADLHLEKLCGEQAKQFFKVYPMNKISCKENYSYKSNM